jgi:hypothetical protein
LFHKLETGVGESEIESTFFEPGRSLAQPAKSACEKRRPARKKQKEKALSALQSIAVLQG